MPDAPTGPRATGPLAGIRIVSVAQQYPGPYATLLLADLGADVVQVERPDRGDPTRAFPGFHGSLARNKRSVALDLKSAPGRAAFRRLAARADAVLEGFRPGTMARLGLAYDVLAVDNPGLVWVSISGFGQTGPNRARAGHDLTYQAEAGMLHEHAPPAPPPMAPTLALGDLSAGLFAVQAVLAGIVARQRTGAGCSVDVSMVDGLISLLTAHIGPVVNGTGPGGFVYEPGYDVFRTSDGVHLALGVAHEDHFWRALCGALDLGDDRHLTGTERLDRHPYLHRRISEAIASRPCLHWEEVLAAADVPYGRVRSLVEAADSPQATARGLLADLGSEGRHVRQPLVFRAADGVDAGRTAEAPAPTSGTHAVGQDTVDVLTEAGFTAAEIDRLLADGVALQAPAGHGPVVAAGSPT